MLRLREDNVESDPVTSTKNTSKNYTEIAVSSLMVLRAYVGHIEAIKSSL